MPLCPAVQGIVGPCTYKTSRVNAKTLPRTEIVRHTGATACHHDKDRLLRGLHHRHRCKVCTGLHWLPGLEQVALLLCPEMRNRTKLVCVKGFEPPTLSSQRIRSRQAELHAEKERQEATAGETTQNPPRSALCCSLSK